MHFGATTIESPLVLSPMVDVTDAAFRSVAAEWGADVTCSEMVSAAGLVHDNPTSWRLAQRWPGESPYGVQIMGGDAEEMAQAATMVGERINPDFIDINLGCPSPRILRSCAGGFLLRDPAAVGRVVAATVEAAGPTPVSVKMRTGPDSPTFLEVGEAAQGAGASWCTLHGRSVAQGYEGRADWTSIARLVDHLDIPVIGNGDLRGPEDVLRMRDETGCAGFFVARAAMRDPTVFRRMRAALDGRPADDSPDLQQRIEVFMLYLERAASIGLSDVPAIRRQATRFMAGAPGAKAVRKELHAARTLQDLQSIMTAVAC